MRYLFLVLLFCANALYGQTKTGLPKAHTFNNYDDLRQQQQKDSITTLVYMDSLLNYRVAIPTWLSLTETNSRMAFGGKLPAVNGNENAIVIKAFAKKEHADMAAFERYIIGEWKFGTHPNWSTEHVCYGLNPLNEHPGIGKSWRASIFYKNRIYTCKYVLTESKTAFLWIDFTSTPVNYELNLPKFEEFMAGFNVIP